jgi:hypothetical protein
MFASTFADRTQFAASGQGVERLPRLARTEMEHVLDDRATQRRLIAFDQGEFGCLRIHAVLRCRLPELYHCQCRTEISAHSADPTTAPSDPGPRRQPTEICAMAKPAKSRTARRKRAGKPKRMSNDLFRATRVLEEENADLMRINREMMSSIVFLLTGEEAEQRTMLDKLIDMISTDYNLADRMVRTMEHNDRLKELAPKLYEMALRMARPGQSLV